MKDFPMFDTEFGIASLVLKEIPYKGEAYILLREVWDAEQLLAECVSFCRMAGAEKIFATGHEEYMSEAFEVYAFDYLMKPFKVERVIQTLERARDRLLLRKAALQAAPAPSAPRAVSGRMMLRHREGVSFVDLQDILLVL